MKKINELLEEIEIEKEFISKTIAKIQKPLLRSERDDDDIVVIGAHLHSIYNGIENIFKRVLEFKNITLPHTETSHKDLLKLLISERIISIGISEELEKYLVFRHFFRHAYTMRLKEDKLIPLAERIFDVWKELESELTTFTDVLKQQQT